jgi:hypothetical protein
MVYINQCCNAKTGKYLSQSSYSGKRSALFQFYRLHNEIGFPEGFQARLKVLFKGFFWNLMKGKTGTAAPHLDDDANNVGVDDARLPRRETTDVD